MADTDKNTVNIPDSVLENNLEKDNVIKKYIGTDNPEEQSKIIDKWQRDFDRTHYPLKSLFI